MTRLLMVPAPEYDRAISRAEHAEAQRDALADALAAVMRLNDRVSNAPDERPVYENAREQLALTGRIGNAEAAEYHAAYAEMEIRKGAAK
jgi:hypothetical protein